MLTMQVHPRGLSPAMGQVTFQGLNQFIALERESGAFVLPTEEIIVPGTALLEEDPLGPIPKPPLEPIPGVKTPFPAGGILAGIGILTVAALGVYLYMGRR
jgi:hypothetical protein